LLVSLSSPYVHDARSQEPKIGLLRADSVARHLLQSEQDFFNICSVDKTYLIC